MASDENLMWLAVGAAVIGIGILIGFLMNGGIKLPTAQNSSYAPTGWALDRDSTGRISSIISLPHGIIQQ